MRKLRLSLCAVLLLTCATNAIAQRNNQKKRNHADRDVAGALQVQLTYRQSKLGSLNSILNANGLHSLPDNNIWLNLSMSHIHKNWLFEDGLGGTFTSSADANNNGVQAKLNQAQFYTRAGYNVSQSTDFRLFPFIGLNLSDAMLRIRDDVRTQSTSNFGNELLNSTSSKTLWNPQLGFEIGGGFDYVIKMKPKQMYNTTIQRNIPIGIRVGYYLQATHTNWKIDDNYNLNNGPSDKQSMVFVSFNIGLGYAVRK